VAVINTAVSLYYYARFIKAMFMRPVGEKAPLALSPSLRVALISAALMVVIVGIYPKPWIALTRLAAEQLVQTSSPLITPF
jgi:NADH-quinone oxidoreductase subunit N